jgi:hypothetical protein
MTLSGMALYGQPGGDTRQAQIRGGGGDGKCTIEVEVDGVAEVEINQTQGRIRTLSGQPARWRRFECNQPMPANAPNLHFRGIDGRGNQALVSGRGGAVVVRIEDPQGGAEGYTFDLEWGGRGGFDGGRGPGPGPDRGYDRGPGPGRGPVARWTGARGGTLQFHGDGRGFFNRARGQDQVVRDVNVRLDRDGNLTVEFEAQGFQRLVFKGQARNISRNQITADLYADGYGRGVDARGVTTIYVDPNGEVDRINMSGRLRRDTFRLNWSAR